MNILDTIIAEKALEVERRKREQDVKALEQRPLFAAERHSLRAFLQRPELTGIIAEFKRKSPSKGVINNRSSVTEVTGAYAAHGASGISVLTDEPFFGGSLLDLEAATANKVPLLRKDFIIDEYQLVEARASGASVILLIAACLSEARVKQLATAARKLGLESLLELHDETELGHICDEVDLVGINNRNLKTFDVSVQRSMDLLRRLPAGIPVIAESGISSVDTVRQLKDAGFSGFLMGEYFMKQEDPAIAFADFAKQLKA
jgi:indole-3-glycerol phosphate synthase